MSSSTVDKIREVEAGQRQYAPQEDLAPYAGEWVAVRDGRVVGHAPSPDLLARQDSVAADDAIQHVGSRDAAYLVV